MTDYHVIIPARYASTRLPGKPLLDIAGKPMIQRVYEQANQSQARSVLVATDDERIKTAVEAFGGQACMTQPTHQSGTDRLQEVVSELGLPDQDIVVNVQGDEPLIPPQVIDQVAGNLAANEFASVATLCEPIKNIETVFDPNAVKVVMDKNGCALYFSRAPIPWSRDDFSEQPPQWSGKAVWQRHIGIYAYRVALLHQFVQWEPCQLEQAESLEQLRVMWNGHRVHVAQALVTPPTGVDTQADLEKVRSLFLGES